MKLNFVVQVPEKGNEWGEKKFIDQLKLLSELGYDGAVLAVRKPVKVSRDMVKQATEGLGLEIPAISTGSAYTKDGLSLSHSSQRVRSLAILHMNSQILLAKDLGGSKVIVGLIRGKLGGESKREYFISALGNIYKFAADRGIQLLLEPINRHETDFIHTLEETRGFIDEIRQSAWNKWGLWQPDSDPEINLKILADTFHMNIEEKSITEALKAHASLIGHVDAADSNRMAPGQGHLDFPSILRTLKEIGYDGHLCIELIPVKPDFETAARQSVEYLRNVLRKI